MTWEVALLLATLIGTACGTVGRYVTWIPNKLVPKIVLLVNIAGNLILVANKFLEAANIGVPGVAWYHVDLPTDVSYAGFFSFLKPILVAAGSAIIGYAQLALQRWVAEKGIKPVFNGTGDSGSF